MKIKIIKGLDVSRDNYVFLNSRTLDKLGIQKYSRVLCKGKGICFFARIGIYEGLEDDEIGVPEVVAKRYDINENNELEIEIAEPDSKKLIEKKLKGGSLSYSEYLTLFFDIIRGELFSEDIAYLTASFCFGQVDGLYGMIPEKELIELIEAMVDTGERLEWDPKDKPILDKHSLGGVPNNRVSLILVPTIAAFGFKIPKLSSRAITSPAGTADTMEVFAKVDLSISEIKNIVKKVNGCIAWGGGTRIAPIDDILIKYRKEYKLDPISLACASILSKKVAVGSEYVVFDIPYGPSCKIKTAESAYKFGEIISNVGRKLGLKIKPIPNRSVGPIGNGIGPVLEARDALYILERKDERPLDLENKAVKFIVELLSMVLKEDHSKLVEKVLELLDKKIVLRQFKKIVEAQGGDPDISSNKLKPREEYVIEVKSPKHGTLVAIDNRLISKLATIAGAPQEKDCGIYLFVKPRSYVEANEILAEVYCSSEVSYESAKDFLEKNFKNIFIIV